MLRRNQRRSRKGELVCYCRAYRFPHRFGGGKCTLEKWVSRYWSKEPHSPECLDCHSYRFGECEVDSGQEGPMECVALVEFIHSGELVVPLKHRPKRQKKKRG